jgi:hypothetical protein
MKASSTSERGSMFAEGKCRDRRRKLWNSECSIFINASDHQPHHPNHPSVYRDLDRNLRSGADQAGGASIRATV